MVYTVSWLQQTQGIENVKRYLKVKCEDGKTGIKFSINVFTSANICKLIKNNIFFLLFSVPKFKLCSLRLITDYLYLPVVLQKNSSYDQWRFKCSILARMTEKTNRTNSSLNPILLVSIPKTREAVLQIYAWSKIYAF